jgi:tetratricopeptide (TPR) repeat protein
VLAEAVLAREGAPGGALEGVLYTLAARAAMHLLFLGRGALAGRLLDALHAHRPDLSEDPAAGAMLDHARAMEAHYAQDPEGSLALTLRASEGFLACGDLRSACIQRVNAGYSYLQFGEHDRAVDTLREALADAEAHGLHHAAALARHNLGLGLLRQGRPEEALVMERLAVEACVAQGDRRTEGGSRMYLAQILWSLGDTAGAVREARHAAQVLQGAPPLRAQALATLSLCLSDPRERLEASRQALDTLDTDGAEEGEALVHRAHAEALSANGLTADALTVVARALERIAQRAARFRDPERAARFPTALPDHEALAALARSLAQVTPQPGDRSPS